VSERWKERKEGKRKEDRRREEKKREARKTGRREGKGKNLKTTTDA